MAFACRARTAFAFLPSMYTTWLVFANRTQAKIFENRGPGRDLMPVQSFDHAEGRLKNRDFYSDKPGRETNHITASSRHSFSSHIDAHDRSAEDFARQLASALELGRAQSQYQKLVLIAEPKFLGMMNTALNHRVRAHVAVTVSKDLLPALGREDIHQITAGLTELDVLWGDVARYGT